MTNPTDPNYTANWAFCEFTFNHDQLYANISYVDFVSRLPIGLSLINASGETKSVIGIPSNGLDLVCSALEEQGSKDGQGWGSLVVKSDDGSNLRVLSPNQAMVMNPSLLTNYYDAYIDQVWSRFSSSPLHIDTQAGFGSVQGQVSGDELVFDDQRFGRPCTRDIFSASSGPFVTGPDAKRNAIIPRLNAAFNRSTLLKADTFPAATDLYYTEDVTNHYGRVVHGVNVDGRGYTHPYDDATPVGGKDQSGFVNDPAPRTLKIVIGGADGTS